MALIDSVSMNHDNKPFNEQYFFKLRYFVSSVNVSQRNIHITNWTIFKWISIKVAGYSYGHTTWHCISEIGFLFAGAKGRSFRLIWNKFYPNLWNPTESFLIANSSIWDKKNNNRNTCPCRLKITYSNRIIERSSYHKQTEHNVCHVLSLPNNLCDCFGKFCILITPDSAWAMNDD